MQVGDVVTVYEDPITKRVPEGKARLVYRRFEMGDILGVEETWDVEFLDEPGETWTRAFHKGKEG